MKVAIYPGSFNPWHDGHTDVLKKALKVFDEVVVSLAVNPLKNESSSLGELEDAIERVNGSKEGGSVRITSFRGLLVDEIKSFNDNYPNPIQAVVRGIRNGADLDFEKAQQYWNEDLGLKIPTLYVVTDRTLVHMSSTAIRMVEKLKK